MFTLWMLLFFSAKKSNQKKLPAAPCSIKGCALALSVVAEQDKADLGWASVGLFPIAYQNPASRKNPLNGEALFNTFKYN
jgi:hypothetical protein